MIDSTSYPKLLAFGVSLSFPNLTSYRKLRFATSHKPTPMAAICQFSFAMTGKSLPPIFCRNYDTIRDAILTCAPKPT